MPSAFWGVAEAVNIAFPDTWQAWLLLSGYLALFVALLFHERVDLQGFTWRKWIGWIALGAAAIVTSLSFPITVSPGLLPFVPSGWQPITVYLLAAIPALLAGITLGPGPALLVGMSSGIGQVIGHTHQPFDLFHYAFAAWIAARLQRNIYQGHMYGALRFPAVSGAIGFSSIALMAGFDAFVNDAELTILGRLDVALGTVQVEFAPLFIEGLLGGLVIALLMLVKPAWKNNKNLAPSPMQRSVSSYLLTHMFVFGALVLVTATLATFALATYLTVRQVTAEMAAGSIATSANLRELQAQMEDALLSDSADELLDGTKADDQTLGRIYSRAKHYEKVMLIDGEGRIAAAYPRGTTTADATQSELEAAGIALREGVSSLVLSDSNGEHSPMSLVVPVYSRPGESSAALVGRISELSLTEMLASLAVSDKRSSGAIVNRNGQLVAHVGEDSHSWYEASGSEEQPLDMPGELGGRLLLSKNEKGARSLIYLTPWDSNNLRVAVTVPFENILSRSLGLAAPLVAVLLVIAGAFYFHLARYSRDLTGSIKLLENSSRSLAGSETPAAKPVVGRQDELGDLGRAFVEMQRGFKQRLDEQSLLLAVSRDASSSIDLADSLPVVLHGMLRATGAAGARALVLSPTRGQPYSFAEGPAADGMRPLDRPLLNQLRSEQELTLANPSLIRQRLALGDDLELAIKSLYAVQLQINGKFLGFLTVGFRQPGSLSNKDLMLMRSLANQASATIEKSYLFANAEGGRRRLVAILKSTSEAVIVTDQTDRILIINSAMETAFDLEGRQVTGRAIADVIDSEALVDALSGRQLDNRNLEVTGNDGRTYFANISPIINRDGHALGRVAVLHDITDLKKLDQLKSEFVDNVSHDLRTPLTVLSGYASALSLMDDLTPEQRDYADNILRSVEQMITIVENLLDLGRLEADVEVSFIETDVGQLLQDMADEHWLFAHESGIRMHVKLQDNLPTIACDPGLIRQAVSNLLTNGFKYAPDSGDMTLAAQMNGDRLVISVRDRGPGIAEKDQARLFEKFYRVKRHGAGKAKGSGLGLAIVKTIAERHGGTAWCYSELGKGSTFFISLPLQPT